MSHLLVVGSLNMDLIAVAPRLPLPGETVIGATFSMACGGKGANQAAAAARLGAPTKMIGRVGDDEFGHRVRTELADSGVGVEQVRIDPETPTATGHVLIDAVGRNAIVVASGANARLSHADVTEAENVWRDAALVVLQLEVSLAANAAAMYEAHRRGLRVILNAAPMDLAARDLIAAADYLVLNEVEAEQLAGEPITTPGEALELAHAMCAEHQRLIVTLGAQGAVLVAEVDRLHQPAPRIDVVDTTAAGDAFVGGFAAAILAGANDVDALRQAVIAGSLACTKLGAMPSLPSRSALGSAVLQPR